MSRTLDEIRKRSWIHAVDDERSLGNSIIVTLANGFDFADDPGCGVKGFDTVSEAKVGTTKSAVVARLQEEKTP